MACSDFSIFSCALTHDYVTYSSFFSIFPSKSLVNYSYGCTDESAFESGDLTSTFAFNLELQQGLSSLDSFREVFFYF